MSCEDKYILEVDFREHFFFNREYDSSINIQKINLPIGDFIYKKNEEILFIIERKTIGDLCNSITDNRFREQKSRLIQSTNDPFKIIYIIEGSKYNCVGRINKSTIDSAIQNLIFKHKYHVIYTENEEDTIDNILTLYNKVKDPNWLNIITLNSELNPIKLIKKKDNYTHEYIYINQLATIPGVSIKIAQEIVKVFPNIQILLEKYKNNPTLLSDIIINKKRLGKALSTKIYNSFGFEILNN